MATRNEARRPQSAPRYSTPPTPEWQDADKTFTQPDAVPMPSNFAAPQRAPVAPQYSFGTAPNANIERGADVKGAMDANLEATIANIRAVTGADIAASEAANAAQAQATRDAIALDRDVAEEGLRRGLRDIGLRREQGLEAVTENALGRNIYNSGVRKEGQQDMYDAAERAESDLRTDHDFTMRSLANRAKALSASMAAARAGIAARREIMNAQIMQARMDTDTAWLSWAAQNGISPSSPEIYQAWQASQQEIFERGGSPGAYGAGR